MGRQTKMGRIIGGLLIGVLLLGGTGLALAGGNLSGPAPAELDKAGRHGNKAPSGEDLDGQAMQSILNSLVASDQITQTQADQILTRQQQLQTESRLRKDHWQGMTQPERKAMREQNQSDRAALLTQLVREGVITQEQADVVRAAMQQHRKALQQERASTALNSLVDKQSITAEQAGAVQAKLNEMQNARQAGMEKMRGMTPGQRRAYMEEKRPANPLSELVASGVLTWEKADQIHKVLGPPAQGGRGMHKDNGIHCGTGKAGGIRGGSVGAPPF